MASITIGNLFRKSARGEITCEDLVKILVGDKKRLKRASAGENSKSRGSKKREHRKNKDGHAGNAKAGHDDEQEKPVIQGQDGEEGSNHLQISNHHTGGDGAGGESTRDLWGEPSSHASEKINKEDVVPEDDTFRDMRGLDVAFPEAGNEFL
jgi:hypothetical protein